MGQGVRRWLWDCGRSVCWLGVWWLCAPAPGAADQIERGRELSIKHCARCHVIGDFNPMGGLGSTPSFMALTWLSDYPERVRTFYARRPHPVFARVPGYARWSDAPAYVTEFEVEPADIDAILAYIRTLEGWKPAPQPLTR